MIRMIHMLRRAPGLTAKDFQAIWRDEHGPLVASVQTDLDILRFVELHPDPAGQDIDTAAAEARGGMMQPFDGIAEYWWKSSDTLGSALATEAGQAAADRLVASERTFVDLPASPLWIATEYPQVATAARRPIAHIRSAVMRLHFAVGHRADLGELGARRYWLDRHGPLIRSHAQARDLLAYNQVHRVDCPLVSAFLAPRKTMARPFLGHAESWFERPGRETARFEKQNAIDAAIEDERNFIDWGASTVLVGKELVFIDREWAA